jgi:hypothetical protein
MKSGEKDVMIGLRWVARKKESFLGELFSYVRAQVIG